MRSMIQSKLVLVLPVLALLAGGHHSLAQDIPVITSFSQNGTLVCSNLHHLQAAIVQWASSANGPWSNLLYVAVPPTNTQIAVKVPMFYRVQSITNLDGMVSVPAGWFTMGDSLLDLPPDLNDTIATNVYVSAFYVDTYLVSGNLWDMVRFFGMNHGFSFEHPGASKAPDQPVQSVTWYDVLKWCNARSQMLGLTPVYYTDAALTQVYTNTYGLKVYANWQATGYRLPTEAEWEKAARGGLSNQRFPWGMTISENQANYYGSAGTTPYDLSSYAGYNTNFTTGDLPYTSPIGYFATNGYGLYDMAGNVSQWCWDVYHQALDMGVSPYTVTNNPTGPTANQDSRHVIRGGSYSSNAWRLRCSDRLQNNFGGEYFPTIGFRCVRAYY
jgi:formylglycine-generating enzyme